MPAVIVRARVLGFALSTAFVFLALPGVASAAIYWGVFNASLQPLGPSVGAASLDGGAPTFDYLRDLESPGSAGSACGVAVTATHLYWAGSQGIGKVNLDGPALPQTIVPGLSAPCGIAVDGSHVYWGDSARRSIGRANLDGSGIELDFVPEVGKPCDVAVADGYLYWVQKPEIGRVKLDGSAPDRHFLYAGAMGGCGLTARAGYLYWGRQDAIARASLDGSEHDDTFIAGTGEIEGIATDSTYIYWVDHPPRALASLGRAKLDGGEPNRSWIPGQGALFADQSSMLGVAVDSRPAPPPLLLPARPLRFGKLRHDVKKGTAILDIWVPDWGTLQLTCPGLRCRVIADSTPHPARGGALRWRAHLRPLRGRPGRRIRAQLKHKGVARATVEATFTYKRTEPVSAIRHLKLRKQLKHPRSR